MDTLTVHGLLDSYVGYVKKGRIQFLKDEPKAQAEVLRLIAKLKEVIPPKGESAADLDWYEAHKHGTRLWRSLASHALQALDPAAKGNSKLFAFLEAATKFEDLLYGLDEYYRDHTLHSLWVYLIGEHVLRDLLPDVHDELNWFVYNDIEREKSLYSSNLLDRAKKKEAEVVKEANAKKDAMWCIMALCHDLGYSLAKLRNLNEKVETVLDYFDIADFRRVGYSLDIEHQYIVSQFLELMAADVRIVPTADSKEPLIKCYRDDFTYWRLCRALERKEHGILSAYLVYKILGFFADVSVRGPAEEWGLDNDEAVNNIVRGMILFGIAQHEFEYAHLNELGSLDEVLVLADELEEFSRYGRQLQFRKYYHTTADSKVSFKKSQTSRRKSIDIDIVYQMASEPQGQLKRFFKHKIDVLRRRYSLEQREEKESRESKYYKIKRIKMTAKGKDEQLWIQLCEDPSKNRAYLPKTKIVGEEYEAKEYEAKKYEAKEYEAKEYAVKMRDDEIRVETEDGKKPSLKEWFDEKNLAK